MARTKRDLQMLKADISFGLMGAFGIIGLFVESFDSTPDIPAAPEPWLTGAAAIVLTILAGLVFTKVAAIDKRRSEEYTFQLISSGAVVSVITTLFVSFIWSSDFLLSHWLGKPSASQMIALLMGSWSVAYYTYRIRGVSE